MKILLAASEIHPYSKTGGLADMVGALGKALVREGHDVVMVTPLYAGIRESFPALRPAGHNFDLPLGTHRVAATAALLEVNERLKVYFIDQPEFYERASLYQEHGVDYPDNAERFIFLSKAVVHLARQPGWKPDVVHAHDWQVGLVPLLMRHEERVNGWKERPRTCFTIHNLAYQGVFPGNRYPLTNLPWDYFTPDGVEFYEQFNCLKAGIAYADSITTVSPRYAREITTPELGNGLDGLLRFRRRHLSGILNGVDYEEWNTTHNPYLRHAYSPENLTGKTQNKLELQRELGLPVDETIPLFGSINRLVDQKGVDIQLGALEEMLSARMQFVLLGTGIKIYEQGYRDLAARYPAQAAVRFAYDQGLSHRIEAGCDFFLLPSRYEPCGLNQMYSLRYGTIPIVRITGGLDDTVVDINEDPKGADGIKFAEYSNRALAKGIRKALALYGEPELRRYYQLNGMVADFSWDRTAHDYLRLYSHPVSGSADTPA